MTRGAASYTMPARGDEVLAPLPAAPSFDDVLSQLEASYEVKGEQ